MEQDSGSQRGILKGLSRKRIFLIVTFLVIVLGLGIGVGLMKGSDNPAFCASCHVMKPYYDSWKNSSLLAKKHADHNVKCHDCHEASFSTLFNDGVRYVTGNYKTPLEKRQFPRDFCLKCHDDFNSIKAKTAFAESNPHDSHNGEQDCNVCHSVHQQSKLMCAQCHVFQWENKLDASWVQ
ncbi:cytochrome c3 [Syntrophothermus lipocalidus]|uniref:NapC/NirT cytochrome c domain protein n=1 Tax=Syntrophothermus lipocalidus (strain DSM 12680 / TGB-C1) TaxID=643648 RepID=D7CNZ8_SYNLT|nr:cytochrome c3 [Syntrophothermus lipocalidus]ADI02433.1 NapC/NirT cytochrome c domain protein [Syntrophothermus lipocalidus DSM 12680]